MDIYFEKEKVKEKIDIYMEINNMESKIVFFNKGINSNTYIYEHSEKKYLVKVNNTFKKVLQYEYSVMKKFNGEYFLPKAYGLLNETVLIEEFIHGEPFVLTENYIELAYVLADIHSIEIKGNVFAEFPNCIMEICKELKEFFYIIKKMSVYTEQFISCVEKKLNELFLCKNRFNFYSRSIIHNDLHSENILLDNKRCRLIDWEQCKVSNYEWDLAHAISWTTAKWTNSKEMTQNQKKEFIRVYCEKRNIKKTEECIERVFFLERYVEFRCILWVLINYDTNIEKEKIKSYIRRGYEL